MAGLHKKIRLVEAALIVAFKTQGVPVAEKELKVWMPSEWPEDTEIDIAQMAIDIERELP